VLEHGEKWEEASNVYRRAGELAPANLDIRRRLARAYMKSEAWEAAAAAYEVVLQQEPRDTESRLRLGQCLLRVSKKDREADAAFLEVLKASSKNSDAWWGIAEIRLRQERWDEAEQAYLKCLEYATNDVDPIREDLMRLYNTRQDWVKSEAISQKLVESQPGKALYHYSLGEVEKFLGEVARKQQRSDEEQRRYDQAVGEYLKAIELYQDTSPGAYIGLGEIYLTEKDYQKARDAFQQAGGILHSEPYQQSRMSRIKDETEKNNKEDAEMRIDVTWKLGVSYVGLKDADQVKIQIGLLKELGSSKADELDNLAKARRILR
jgi:tetratricopeptide (TPR) repeat protein